MDSHEAQAETQPGALCPPTQTASINFTAPAEDPTLKLSSPPSSKDNTEGTLCAERGALLVGAMGRNSALFQSRLGAAHVLHQTLHPGRRVLTPMHTQTHPQGAARAACCSIGGALGSALAPSPTLPPTSTCSIASTSPPYVQVLQPRPTVLTWGALAEAGDPGATLCGPEGQPCPASSPLRLAGI